MKVKAVIFDWAGTTVDYGSFAPVQAFIEAFKRFGIIPTADEVRAPMGMLKRMHIQTMLEMPRIKTEWQIVNGRDWTEQDVEVVYQASEECILPILKDFAEPKSYVLEAVQKLRENGVKIGSTTGYTDSMMNIVVPVAKEKGYSPDCWFSPNSTENMGRPYPYMIYKCMQTLKIMDITTVVKVGDTVADIKEGKNAGVVSIGIIEGSSVMGLSEAEYNALSETDKQVQKQRVTDVYKNVGADFVINHMGELTDLLEKL